MGKASEAPELTEKPFRSSRAAAKSARAYFVCHTPAAGGRASGLAQTFTDVAVFLNPHRLHLRRSAVCGTDSKSGSAKVRARALIRKVRLEGKEDAYPGELSGGQQQRVAIARSLAMNPDVMLFDEVTAALDPETVKEVLVTIRELAADSMTCILVTHEMGFARELADHIYFTDRGVIVEHGPPATFFKKAKDPRTKEFLSQIL